MFHDIHLHRIYTENQVSVLKDRLLKIELSGYYKSTGIIQISDKERHVYNVSCTVDKKINL
jgi:hypothetical protein